MKKINSILPTQSLIYFLVCGTGILVFVLLIIIPTQKTSAELDRDIDKLNARIDEQRILRPIFDNLLKQVKKKGPTEIPVTQKNKLAPGISAKFQSICWKLPGATTLSLTIFKPMSMRWRIMPNTC